MYNRELQIWYGCRVATNQDPREAGRKTRRRLPGQVKRKWSDRGRPCALKRSSPVRRWNFRASWETERRKNRRTVSGTTPESLLWKSLRGPRSRAPETVRCPPVLPVPLDPPVLRGFGPFVAESCLESPPPDNIRRKRLESAAKRVNVGWNSNMSG